MHQLMTSSYTTITDLKRSPRPILNSAKDAPIAVLSHNRPTAYIMGNELYKEFLALKEAALIAKRIESAEQGNLIEVSENDWAEYIK